MHSLLHLVLGFAALAAAQCTNVKLTNFTANFDKVNVGSTPVDNYASVGWSNFVVLGAKNDYNIKGTTPPRLVAPLDTESIPYIYQTNYTNGGNACGGASIPQFSIAAFSFGCSTATDSSLTTYQPSACTIAAIANSNDLGRRAAVQNFTYTPTSTGTMTAIDLGTTQLIGTQIYFAVIAGSGATVLTLDSIKIQQYINSF